MTAHCEPVDRMQCMEVWGGNSTTDRHISTPGLQIWVSSQPYADDPKGGDVYYVSSCASGRITRLLLADVCGHGASVAATSHALKQLMRRNVNMIKQKHFVSAMNEQFSESSSSDSFATAVVCSFFSPTKSLQISNAGHPNPYLYRAATDSWDLVNLLDADRSAGIRDIPLGITEDAGYSSESLHLSEGDAVLCVSDAFTESIGENGKMLGGKGLLETIQRLSSSGPGSIISQLRKRIRSWDDSNLEQDDATAVLFQADGTSTTLTNSLLAPYRMVRGVRESL